MDTSPLEMEEFTMAEETAWYIIRTAGRNIRFMTRMSAGACVDDRVDIALA